MLTIQRILSILTPMLELNQDEVETAALQLDPKARAKLAGRLLQSLEFLSDAEYEIIWAEEAAARYAEIASGETALRSAADVLAEARQRLA